MKKNLIAIALLSSIATASIAGENGFFVGVDSGSVKNTDINVKVNAAGLTGGYRHYINEKVSVEGSLSYSKYSTDAGDEAIILPQVGLGYDIGLNDNFLVRPKVKIGYGTVEASEDNNPETVSSAGVGLELVFKQKYSIEYNFRKMNANDYKTDTHQISFNYKF